MQILQIQNDLERGGNLPILPPGHATENRASGQLVFKEN